VLALAMENPAWGCNRLSGHLALEGVALSSVTVQNILSKHGMGSRYERLLKLEERACKEKLELSAEQVKQIEKANPAFAERHVESGRPGELLCQDVFYVGRVHASVNDLKGVGKVYLHSVVDTFGSVAFGFLHTSKQPEAAVAVLHNEALPFYNEREIPVGKVLTDNGREFCGTDAHPYELYLSLNEIRHKHTRVNSPRTNGFVERFHRTVSDEFFRQAFRTKLFTSVEELQADLDAWLRFYNGERPHQGYRNLGRRPLDAVNDFPALPDWRERCAASLTRPTNENVSQEG